MLFEQVIGQLETKQTLLRMMRGGRFPHALLLVGPEGSGKLALALACASYLVCTDPQAGDSCGQCSACRKSLQQLHPDVHFAFPVIRKDGKKREDTFSNDFLPQWRDMIQRSAYFSDYAWWQKLQAEGKQGDINTKECNEIIKKLSYKAFAGGRKVLVLWMPEYLGKNGNRLLKLIEEPPADTHVILVAEKDEAILNTILSRCQVLRIPPIQDDELRPFLFGSHQLSDEEIEQVLFVSQGNYCMVQRLLNGEEGLGMGERFADWLRVSYAGKPQALMAWAEQFAGMSKEGQKQFFAYALRFMEEVHRLSILGMDHCRLTASEQDLAKRVGKMMTLEKTRRISEMCSDCITWLERNANSRILMMATSIRLGRLLKASAPALV